MTKRVCALTIPLVLLTGSVALAQIRNLTPGPSNTKAITLIDQPEIKIQRVEILPNATRGLHSHEDVVYHVFITMDSALVLTIQGEAAPVRLEPWQSHFFTGGTVHAITNPGSAPVQFLEVFVNKSAKTASLESARALVLSLAGGVQQP